MEIIYCSKCGSMIPPGGVEEGKRYLKGSEPLCPKCYKDLPDEEHDGSTMVVSETIVEQLARHEPEPDFSLQPKASKLMPGRGRRKRPSTHSMDPAQREKRPSGPHKKIGSRAGLIGLLSAGGLVLGAVILFVVLRGREEGPRPTPPPVVSRPDPQPQPDPVPVSDPQENKEKKRLARLKQAFESAADYWEKNPGSYGEAISRFLKVRDDSAGTTWETKAQDSVTDVKKARERAAGTAFGSIAEKAGMLAGDGDYDSALAELGKCPKELEPDLGPRLEAERANLRKQAEEKIGAALSAAGKLSAEGRPELGIAELDKVSSIKYASLAKKLDELRKRLESEKLNEAETARKRKKADAMQRWEQVLAGFERKAMGGHYAEAQKFASEERRGVDPEKLKLMPVGTLEAAEKLAAELVRQEGERRKQIEALVGKEVELHLAVGGTLKGKVDKFKDSALHVTVRMRSGASMGHVVKLSALAPGGLAKLLPATKLEGAEAHLAAAIDALAGRDLAGAGKFLPAAKEHPLFARWSARLAKLDAAYCEKAAGPFWEQKIAPLILKEDKEYSERQGQALIAALDAFEKDYGATGFARGKRDELKSLRRTIAGPTIEEVSRLFKGKVVKFDQKTLEIELFYDFETPDQASDWGSGSVEKGKLRLAKGGEWNHKRCFKDYRISLESRLLGVGHFYICPVDFYHQASAHSGPIIWRVPKAASKVNIGGQHVISIVKAGARCVLSIDGKQIWDVSAPRILRDIKAKQDRGLLMVMDRRITGQKGEFDNLRISGRLDRAWLDAALAKESTGDVLAGLAAADVQKIFNGKLVRFDPKTLAAEIFYDFSKSDQLADFKSYDGPAKVEKGLLMLKDSERVEHRARFGSNFNVKWQWQRKAQGNIGVMVWSGPRSVAVYLFGAETGLWYNDRKAGNARVGDSGVWRGALLDGKFTAHANDKRLFEPLAVPGGTARFGLYAIKSSGSFDNVSVYGRLDRAWLAAALQKRGATPATGGGEGSGLLGEYFAAREFKKLAFERIDGTVNFRWGKGSPAKDVPADGFSVRWTGELVAPAAGEYTFYAKCDDDCTLRIDGKQVMKGVVTGEGKVRLAAHRRHKLVLEYTEANTLATMILSWSGPGIEGKQVVAEKYLFPPAGTASSAWRGTWKKLPGKYLKGMKYIGHVSAVLDPKRNNYVLLLGDFRVFAYSLAEDKWSVLSEVVAGDGKTFPARSVNTSAVHDAKRDGVYFNAASSSKHSGSGGFLFFDLQKRKWTPLVVSPRQPRNAPLGLVGGEPIRHNGDILSRFDLKSGAWRKIHCGALPMKRAVQGSGNLAYDSHRKRFLLFSGGDKLTDTWSYDPARKAWTQLRPAASPSARRQHSMCYDPVNDVVVLQGGSKESDTWVFDPAKTSWSKVKLTEELSTRPSLLAYDPKGKRMVAFDNKHVSVCTLKIEPGAGNSPAGAFLEKDGILAIEAESFTGSAAGSGKLAALKWEKTTAHAGYVGTGAVRAVPAKSGLADAEALQNAPRLDYAVDFETAGEYRISVRMLGPGGDGLSIYAGVDGKRLKFGRSYLSTGKDGKWDWETGGWGAPATVKIDRPGRHTLNIWMRESGVVVDRIVLACKYLSAARKDSLKESFRGSRASVPKGTDSPRPFLEKDGRVIIEARSFTSRGIRQDKPGMDWTSTKGESWGFVTTPKSSEAGRPNRSAMLGYAIRFTRPGNYYVWMRRRYKDDKQNSCFVQLAEKSVVFDDDDAEKGVTWGWFRHPQSFKVAAGDQQLIVSRREGGYRINLIVLTDKADYRPDMPVRESPRGSAAK